MATQARMFGSALRKSFEGLIKWGEAANCKVALMKSTYSPNQDTQEQWSDVSAHEISAGDGYTAGGKALTWSVVSGAFSYDADTTPGGIVSLLADDITWTALTKSGADAIRSAVVWYDGGSGGLEALIGYVLWDANTTLTAEDFTIAWAGSVVGKIGLEGSTP